MQAQQLSKTQKRFQLHQPAAAQAPSKGRWPGIKINASALCLSLFFSIYPLYFIPFIYPLTIRCSVKMHFATQQNTHTDVLTKSFPRYTKVNFLLT